jgi:cold shock CspA family protein
VGTEMDTQAKLIGTIEKFFVDKGFGFARTKDGKSHFVHVYDLIGDGEPSVGDKVSFVPGTGKDGRSLARQVEILNK